MITSPWDVYSTLAYLDWHNAKFLKVKATKNQRQKFFFSWNISLVSKLSCLKMKNIFLPWKPVYLAFSHFGFQSFWLSELWHCVTESSYLTVQIVCITEPSLCRGSWHSKHICLFARWIVKNVAEFAKHVNWPHFHLFHCRQVAAGECGGCAGREDIAVGHESTSSGPSTQSRAKRFGWAHGIHSRSKHAIWRTDSGVPPRREHR